MAFLWPWPLISSIELVPENFAIYLQMWIVRLVAFFSLPDALASIFGTSFITYSFESAICRTWVSVAAPVAWGCKWSSSRINFQGVQARGMLAGDYSFFKYWLEAYISEIKIPYKLHSNDGHKTHNLLENRHSYSKNSRQWWKTLLVTGLELTALRSTVADDNSDSIYSSFLGALV